jgi:hypothetical protein
MTMKIKIGARKIGAKKAEALAGREENRRHKDRFKSGPHARTDANAGRKTPLIPAEKVVTPPSGVESEARS